MYRKTSFILKLFLVLLVFIVSLIIILYEIHIYSYAIALLILGYSVMLFFCGNLFFIFYSQIFKEKLIVQLSLKRANILIRDIVANLHEGLIVLDKNNLIISFNYKFKTFMRDFAPEICVGRDFYSIFTKFVTTYVRSDINLEEEKIFYQEEVQLYLDDGSIILFRSTLSTMGYKIFYCKDITIENKFHREKRLRDLGYSIVGLIHDFNNLTSQIVGYGNLLAEELHNKRITSKYLGGIISACQLSSTLFSQMFIVEKEKKQKEGETFLIDLIKDLADVFKMISISYSSEINFNIDITSSHVMLGVNGITLGRLIMNLCNNSKKAIGKKSYPENIRKTISVSIKSILFKNKDQGCMEEEELSFLLKNKRRKRSKYLTNNETNIFVSSYLTDNEKLLRIKVTDNGIGMNLNQLRRAFEIFYHISDLGFYKRSTGVGLTEVLLILQKANGGIYVSSRENVGTSFLIYLPIFGEIKKRDKQEDKIVGEVGLFVLIIEDEELVGIMIKKILEAVNYKTVLKTNPLEGVSFIFKNKERISLIICDQIMPMKTGISLLKEIREKNIDIPFILCTGYINDVRIHENEYKNFQKLIKPFTKTDLLAKVELFLSDS